VHRLVQRLRTAPGADRGVSIIEVMVAMTVFALIAMGVAAGIVSTMYLTQDNRSREAALNLASQEIDEARSTKDVFTLDDDTSSQTVGGEVYSIARTTNWINSDGSDQTCGAGTGVLAYKRIAITVSWTSGTSPRQKTVVLDTLVAPSSSVSSATSSSIVVGVQTSTGGPNQGVKVTITPVGNGAGTLNAQPALTDGNGCTYALGVKPGSYTVLISKAGNIDPDGQTAPSKPVTTSAGGTGNQTFLYDQPTVITSKYASNAPSGVKLPTAMTTTFTHGLVSTVSSTSTTSLFPYSDGWSAVAGTETAKCTNVDPSMWPPSVVAAAPAPALAPAPAPAAVPGSTPTPTPTPTPAPVPSQPMVADPKLVPKTGTVAGANDVVNLPMGVVDVKTSLLDTVLVATSKNLTAVPNGDPGCSPTTTYTFTGLNSAKATTIALPYGTWTFRTTTAVGLLGTNTPTVSATPSAKNVYVAVSGSDVLLDPRTVPAS